MLLGNRFTFQTGIYHGQFTDQETASFFRLWQYGKLGVRAIVHDEYDGTLVMVTSVYLVHLVVVL